MRKWFMTAACTVAIAGIGAGAAFAGETTGPAGPNGGSGTPTAAPAHANSICAFSGLNNPADGPDAGPGRTQSFGQVVRFTGPLGGIPGTECNGHTGDLAGGGGA